MNTVRQSLAERQPKGKKANLAVAEKFTAKES
jgi:hypothetical protein